MDLYFHRTTLICQLPVCFPSIDLSARFFPLLPLFYIFKLFLCLITTWILMLLRLPAVVSKLHKLINCNGGVTYIHCTAGLGRAPAVAVGLHSTVFFCFLRQPIVLQSPFVSL